MNLHGRSFYTVAAYAVAFFLGSHICHQLVFAGEAPKSGLSRTDGFSAGDQHSNAFPTRPLFLPAKLVWTPYREPPSLAASGDRPRTQHSARVTTGPKRVVLFFGASWCGPCRQMNPIVERLKREGFAIQKVDIDLEPGLTKKYNVTSIPHFVMVADGEIFNEIKGSTSEESLRRLLQMSERRSIPVPAILTVHGRISDNRLRSVVPYKGIVRDRQDWTDICETWHLDPVKHQVDFETQFVIVKTSESSQMSFTLEKDHRGNLECNGICTADAPSNGFVFKAVVVSREGIVSVDGESLIQTQ